jgi:phosphoserine phosphatase
MTVTQQITKLVVFDLDGVLADAVSSWCWIHDHFGVNNDASLREFLEGKIDDQEFMRRDIELWLNQRKRVSLSEIDEILSTLPIMHGAKETIAELDRNGIGSAIISGGIEIHAERVARELGINYVMANPFETDEHGFLTGRGIVNVPLLDKGSVLVRFLERVGLTKEDCVSVGNSQIDVPLFKNSRLGIAFNPYDEIVKEHADVVIEKKDLREILPHVLD